MLGPRQHITDSLNTEFAALREEVGVRDAFPAEVLELAATRAQRPSDFFDSHLDRRDLEFSSIDPPGARDLDQAFHIASDGDGFRLHYAIADMGSWVDLDDAIDVEARQRGTTIYSPDRRIPLHPPTLSEGAASLLEGVDRPAIVWDLRIDSAGITTAIDVERCLVRNRRALTYEHVQCELDSGSPDEQFVLLRRLGEALIDAEQARGGVSLELPEQSVTLVDGHYELRYDAALDVESFNAQLSLATGRAAAQLMIDAGFGILRTLPRADPSVFDSLRLSARSLGADWPDSMSYPEWVRTLNPRTAEGAALMNLAGRTLRGSSYLAFTDGLSNLDGDPYAHEHAAIAAPYAHVTAPLRRLVDRFANECVLAAAAGEEPSPRLREAIGEIPSTMGRTMQVASRVTKASIDLAEAAAMLHLVGHTFDAMVISSARGSATLQLRHPAVIASVDVELPIGHDVRVRLEAASLDGPVMRFRPV